MLSASRQARHWLAIVVAVGVVVATGSVSAPASANEPTDLRLVSVTRGDDGVVTMVVSVPALSVAAAALPGGLTVESATGTVLSPTVSALPPSATAVAVVLHTAGAEPAAMRQAAGTAAELLRSLDPAIAATIVTTTGGAVLAPLGVDRTAGLAALAHTIPDAPVSLGAAIDAVAAQFAGHGYVQPVVVVVDAAPTARSTATLPTDELAPAGMAWRIIPLGSALSPLVAQFSQRSGVTVPPSVDPIALVDEAVGILEGRFSVRVADPGPGALTVRVRAAGSDLALPVALPAPGTTAPPATALASTIAPTTTEPVILAERTPPSVAAVASPTPGSSGTSSWWLPVVGGAVAIAAVGGGALALRRRRSARSPELSVPAAPARASAAVYHYTDLSEPLPSGAVRSRPRREIVTREVVARVPIEAEPAPAPSEAPASEAYERRRRVLALAEELGNVSEACRIVGVSRRSYYEWKRIAEEQGVEALRPKRERPS
jgi:hypothetical protein